MSLDQPNIVNKRAHELQARKKIKIVHLMCWINFNFILNFGQTLFS